MASNTPQSAAQRTRPRLKDVSATHPVTDKPVLRKRDVMLFTALSDRTIDRLEAAGDFPQRMRLGPRAVGWDRSLVMAWIESRQRGIKREVQA